jgi:two-component system OmpR family sensor kinase/two-component system sensor histidine kinase BaeS
MALAFAALLFLSTLGAGSLMHVAPWPLLTVVWPIVFILLIVAVRRFGVPLGEVVDAAGRIADGDYAARVAEQGPPSLRMVARAFNSMASKLEVQNKQRRELMADIAHELRTPLSVIQGRLEGLLDGVYARDDAQLNQVLGDTRVLARLVDDLRTLAQSDSGTLALQKEATDLAILAQDVFETFSGEAASHHVSLRLDAPSDLPLVSVDPLRIREVLMNLLSNAVHHTPSGGSIVMSVKRDNDRIAMAVADTGKGIAPEDVPRIFDRFYKGRTSHGSGLGLTIARNLVTAHGGNISADSRPGEGTTMTFTLPVTEI